MTPLMQQYHAVKAQYPEALVLFQVGDFYELFHDDAKKAAEYLHITLTKRGKSDGEPIPLCGVPKHAADHYIMKLVQGGFHVVMCDQTGEVETGKLVDRKVSAVLTPGMLHDARLLDAQSANIVAVIAMGGATCALWWFELITGRCEVTVIPTDKKYLLDAELVRLSPREVVVGAEKSADELAQYVTRQGYSVVRSAFTDAHAVDYERWLRGQVSEHQFYFMEQSPVVLQAGCLWYAYVQHHAPEGLATVCAISFYSPHDFLMLDAVTQRDLELVANTTEGSRSGTLWRVLDYSATAMGSRIIRAWLLRPLYERSAIEARHAVVEHLVAQPVVRKHCYELLRSIGDLERIAGRIVLARAPLHDYQALKRLMPSLLRLAALVEQQPFAMQCTALLRERVACAALTHILDAVLSDDPARESRIKAGYHDELDKLQAVALSGEQAIATYEAYERAKTGIASLKVRLNGAYGYGIEVTKTHRNLIPEGYKLVQTLVNRDRFSTAQLVQLEHDLHYATERAQELEQQLFNEFVLTVRGYGALLRAVANDIAWLDGVLSFAQAAVNHRYVKPTFTSDRTLVIEQGRHPVIEQGMNVGVQARNFVANSVRLTEHERLWIITGPNMGGKSTFLRQVALIVIMAQAGSFVPAHAATLPLIDRIFTRIGATDRVNEGKSTFWVEMEEVARMCREATEQSLIILDEVGRGTSTYDGMALAQAVLEHLEGQVRVLGLCATHYHEVARSLQARGRAFGVYHVAVARTGGTLALLHSIRPGIAEGSFGLMIAEQAGILPSIINRAHEVLKDVSSQ